MSVPSAAGDSGATRRAVLHQPRPRLRDVFVRRRAAAGAVPRRLLSPEESGRGRITTCLGRDAIHLACRVIARRNRTIWLPAMHCGVEVQAAIDAGLAPRFYGHDADLTVDFTALAELLRSDPAPVLIIHHFGIPQPATPALARLCRELDVPLIEDNCHGLFSRLGERSLGSFGSLAVTSAAKVLGTMDGAFLTFDRDWHGAEQLLQLAHGRRRAWWPLARLAARKLGRAAAPLDRLADASRSSPETAVHPRDHERRISITSERAAATAVAEEVVTVRRRNWLELSRILTSVEGWLPLTHHLPEGASPLCFGVLVQERDAVWQALLRRGVDPYIFGRDAHPALPRGRFPKDDHVRSSLIGLPAHHDLTMNDVQRIARAFEESLRECGVHAG